MKQVKLIVTLFFLLICTLNTYLIFTTAFDINISAKHIGLEYVLDVSYVILIGTLLSALSLLFISGLSFLVYKLFIYLMFEDDIKKYAIKLLNERRKLNKKQNELQSK